MDQRYLYIIFSATPTKIGRFIRSITRSEYNHISVSLDTQLHQMYSFARYYYRTPFYGGFVLESPSRYWINGESSRIAVYKLPIDPETYDSLSAHLKNMLQRKERFLYNHFSAWAVPFRRRIPTKDAYACVEFCMEIMQIAGVSFDPSKYYTIKDLQRILHAYQYYMGSMPRTEEYDAEFFSKKPIPYPLLHSLRSIMALIPRIGK